MLCKIPALPPLHSLLSLPLVYSGSRIRDVLSKTVTKIMCKVMSVCGID